MASKMVTDRQKSAALLLAILDAQGARLRAGLEADLGGEAGAAGLAYLAGMGSRLATARDAMVAADEAHEAELGDDPAARDARDAASSALRERMITLREIVRGVYGAAAEEAVFTGRIPMDAVVVARTAGEVATRLEAARLPEPRVSGAALDVAALAAELRAGRAALEKALDDVAREAREAQVTLTEKTESMAAYDRVFVQFASSLFSAFESAGEPALAARVRPSRRRPGQLDVVPPDVDPALGA
ncbi:MAG: hypothetical protein AAGH15_01500 [Myxococcota bacterium]